MAAAESASTASASALALAVVDEFETGRFSEAEARFSAPLRAAAPAAAVAGMWRGELAGRRILARGPVALRDRPDGLVTARVPLRFADGGGMDVVMSVDGGGTLHGLRLAPPADATWTAPPYAAPRRLREFEVVVGSGRPAVPGTVTLPRRAAGLRGRLRRGGVPGVVLLAGGGPFDRDGTAGPNKPYKDLAWGLATRGIAALRFDKATHVHADEWNERGFTLEQEYVPHAVAAVRLLQSRRGVDPERVFVLGHSAGGKAAPRVARAEGTVAGLVILAGDAYPMHETAVRVARHIARLDPGVEADAAVALLTEQAARAADPELDPATPARLLPFGLPAAYWLDLRAYDPVGTAAAVGKPMFLAQGGRDYQVTEEHDLAAWRAGLGDRPDVDFRVYPADDHLFFPGTGPATPASYRAARHVDPALVADLAAWLHSPIPRP